MFDISARTQMPVSWSSSVTVLLVGIARSGTDSRKRWSRDAVMQCQGQVRLCGRPARRRFPCRKNLDTDEKEL
jgi:hypothetical protein